MNRIRVLIADDHALVRSGLRLVLESMEGVLVIAEAMDGRQALAQIEPLRPDIAILDISMPGLNGIETVDRISSRFPATRTIVLSMYGDETYVVQALRAGASGYLLKDATPGELELALRAVARGETYLSPRISGTVVAQFLQSTEDRTGPLDRLTPRQREILQLIAEGHSTKHMATLLKVSVKTIETHRAQLMERLAIHDIAGLVRFAVRAGIVSRDD